MMFAISTCPRKQTCHWLRASPNDLLVQLQFLQNSTARFHKNLAAPMRPILSRTRAHLPEQRPHCRVLQRRRIERHCEESTPSRGRIDHLESLLGSKNDSSKQSRDFPEECQREPRSTNRLLVQFRSCVGLSKKLSLFSFSSPTFPPKTQTLPAVKHMP